MELFLHNFFSGTILHPQKMKKERLPLAELLYNPPKYPHESKTQPQISNIKRLSLSIVNKFKSVAPALIWSIKVYFFVCNATIGKAGMMRVLAFNIHGAS
jgi:hypothetical protein